MRRLAFSKQGIEDENLLKIKNGIQMEYILEYRKKPVKYGVYR